MSCEDLRNQCLELGITGWFLFSRVNMGKGVAHDFMNGKTKKPAQITIDRIQVAIAIKKKELGLDESK